MPAASEYDLITLDAGGGTALACWHASDARSQVELHSTALLAGGRIYFVDPIELAAAALAQLLEGGVPAAVILTNANHARSAAHYRQRFSIGIQAHEDATAGLGLTLDAALPSAGGPVLDGVLDAVPLPGAVAGETALYFGGAGGVFIVGDALIHLPGYGFSILPAKYCENPRLLRRSLSQLLKAPFATMTMAHGEPIVSGAQARLATLLDGEETSPS